MMNEISRAKGENAGKYNNKKNNFQPVVFSENWLRLGISLENDAFKINCRTKQKFTNIM